MENKIDIYLIAFFVSFVLFVLGTVLLFAQYKNRQKIALQEKEALEQQHQQALLATQLEIQQQTMQHIGREIHDSVGQKLTLASLYTQQLEFTNKYPAIQDQLLAIGNVINESLAELRSLSKSLTESPTLHTHLPQLIEMECKKVEATGKCRTAFHNGANETSIAATTKNILFRVVQEFMQNSLKHSGCKLITIQLRSTTDGLLLLLQDDGKGFDIQEQANGIGLQNIQKRAALIQAELQLNSTLGKGTSLQLFIPKASIV